MSALLTGLLYPVLRRALKKDNHLPAILITLVIAMVGGRLVGGAAKALLLTFGAITSKAPFTMAAFISSYFVGTAVGATVAMGSSVTAGIVGAGVAVGSGVAVASG